MYKLAIVSYYCKKLYKTSKIYFFPLYILQINIYICLNRGQIKKRMPEFPDILEYILLKLPDIGQMYTKTTKY